MRAASTLRGAEAHRGQPVISVRRMAGREGQSAAVTHVGHTLGFLLEGEVHMDIGGEVVGKPGSFLIIPAGVPHRALRSATVDFWGLGFCSSCLGMADDHPLLSAFARVRRGDLPLVPVDTSEQAWVRELFARLAAAEGSHGAAALEQQRALLVLILAALQRALEARAVRPSNTTSDDLVLRALLFIEENALGPLSLKDVAAACHCTASHLASCVKNSTGHTVGSWIASIRIAAASGWLLHSDDSIEAVAERVGWRDKTHFIRQFKKIHGLTPAAWRRRARAL